MALSHALRTFCDNWRLKAETYSIDTLGGAFDRFFTSYVVFNRLYAETTYRLAQRGQVMLRDRFPDSQAAQEYVIQYCGAQRLTNAWRNDLVAANAIREIAEHLRERRFALRLNPMTGARRPDKDRELLEALGSRGQNRQAKGVLEALYAIRCNIFHGQKGFEAIQLELLRPAIVLLETTVRVLYDLLDRNDN